MNWKKIGAATLLALNLGGLQVAGKTFESLYSFPEGGGDGAEPHATLTVGPDGNLYGTTVEGGGLLGGTAFKVSPGSGAVSFILDFNPEDEGRQPYARLINIGDGNLYGVTERNRTLPGDPAGAVFRMAPNGNITTLFQIPSEVSGLDYSPTNPRAIVQAEPGALHVLCGDYPGIWRVPLDPMEDPEIVYTFAPNSGDGDHARSLIRGSDGYLYGTTKGLSEAGGDENNRGTIFRIKPDGSEMTRLHDCQVETGTNPLGALVEGPDGNFYGTMNATAKYGRGCIFRISPEGDYEVLHHFNDLSRPSGNLLLARDGYLYGTASSGGTNGAGGIFRIRMDGKKSTYEILHQFKYTDGSEPVGGLVLAKDGALYGTTSLGGSGNKGTVFRLKLDLPVNRRPVAVDDVVLLAGDEVLIPVLKNDFDADDDPLTVKVTSNPANGTAVVQSNGSILYTPANDGVVSDSFTYTVTDTEGETAEATVHITDTAPQKGITAGVYGGLLSLDPDLVADVSGPRARLSLTVKPSGTFSGVLFAERKRVSFKGRFNDEQTAQVSVKLSGKRKGTLFLSAPVATAGVINGALFGAEVSMGEAGLAQAPLSGGKEHYTIVGRPAFGDVEGYGYGVMKVSKKGSVKITGKLADGTKLSAGGNLISLPGSQQLVPLFCEPLAGGSLGGYLESQTYYGVHAYGGEVRWTRPPGKPNKPYSLGFDRPVDFYIVQYIAPKGSTQVIEGNEGSVTLVDVQGTYYTGDFTLSGKGFTLSAPLKSLSVNRKTGLFKGSMKGNGKVFKFGGAIDQAIPWGAGHVTVEGQSHAVELFTDESTPM